MLYLDSSALAKLYWRELGSDAVLLRLRGKERVFTSALAYAEILAALGRKHQMGELTLRALEGARESFLHDWIFVLNVIEVDTKTMSALPDLVLRYPMKAGDAVHLSAALWLRDTCRLVPEVSAGDNRLEFCAADKALARIAAECGLAVFNPEALP